MPGGTYSSGKQKGRNVLPETRLAPQGINVVARPTDPYVQTFKDADTNNIFGQLQGLVKATTPLAEAGAQEAQDQGRRGWNPGAPDIEGPNGELIPGSAPTRNPEGLLGKVFTKAYQSGYDKIDGEHKASLYYNEAYQYAQENKLKPAADVKAGLAEIRQKYMGAMVSDVQLDAWLPKAATVEEKLIHDHVVDGVKLQHDEATVALNGVLRDRVVSNYLMPSLAKIGITHLEQLKTDEGIDRLQDNIATIGPELRTGLRAFLTNAQNEFGGTHSKAEISEMVSNLMIGIAQDTQTPELLDFAKEPEGVAGSPTLRDRNDPAGNNLGAKLDRADKVIEQSRHTMMVQRREERIRLEKERTAKEMVLFATSAGNLYKLPPGEFPEALSKMEQMKDDILKTHPNITVPQYVELTAIYNSVAKRGTHPPQTLPSAEYAFWEKYRHGNVTPAYVAEHADQYSEQDTSNFYSLAGHQAAMRVEKDKEKRDAYFTPRKMDELAFKTYDDTVNPKDSTGTYFLDSMGKINAAEAQEMHARLSSEWSKANGNKAPDQESLDKIVSKVHAKYPPFAAPTAEQWQAAVKAMEASPTGIPKSWEEYQNQFAKMSTIQRYVASAILKGKGAPVPPKPRQY